MRTWIISLNAFLVAWLMFAPTGFSHAGWAPGVHPAFLAITTSIIYVAMVTGLLTIAAVSMGPKSVASVYCSYIIIAAGIWQTVSPLILGTGGEPKAWVTTLVSGPLFVIFTGAWLWLNREQKDNTGLSGNA